MSSFQIKKNRYVTLEWSLIEKNSRCGNTRKEKKSETRQIPRWKDACRRDLTTNGLREGDVTNMAELREKTTNDRR